MKTTKKLFVLCLVLILALASVMPSFAWFNHNASNSGYGIYYKREELPVSQNGNVDITQTQSYTMENNKIKLNSEKNKIVDSTTATSVDPDHIQFYKTTIQNSGSADAYVNLYADGLTNSVNVLIGTNFPTINEQIVGKSERHLKANPPRIYFETAGAKTWKDKQNNQIYLWAKVGGSYTVTNRKSMSRAVDSQSNDNYFKDSNGNWTNTSPYDADDKTTFYADLPEGATEFYISTESTADANNTTGFKRTRTFTSFVPQTVYSLTGYTTNDANLNAACTTRTEAGAMSVPYVLDTVYTALGGSVYVNLPGGSKGCSATYALKVPGETTIYNLVPETGKLTLLQNPESGSGIKTTITGTALGDTKTVDTSVEREANKSNIPICTNILVPKKVGGKDGEVYVEWYISNELQSSVNVPVNNLYLKY